MPILIEQLSVWDISFRWAGYDPRKVYIRIPLEVEDNARNLIKAIHEAELACESITLEKREFEKDEVKFSFYYWVDDFFSTTSGKFISRKLLKWAQVDRYDFMQWCQRMNAPLPEFWFPLSWNLQYELPENDYYPGLMHDLKYWPEEERKAFFENRTNSAPADESNQKSNDEQRNRPSYECRIACQQVAKEIWRKEPDRTIASVVKDPLIQDYCSAKRYAEATVRGWIQKVAPVNVSSKRGRPRKNGD